MGNNYMPSEIARLILGYLKEINCQKTTDVFLTECLHLKEYAECLRNGREYPTNIGGKSLIAILDDYSYLKNNDVSRHSPQSKNKIDRKNYEDRACSPMFVVDTSSVSSMSSDKDKNEDDTWKSPRRKTHPLKRKINFSPLSTPRVTTEPEDVVDEVTEGVDFSVVYEQFYQNTDLHELIADKINEAVSISTQPNLQDEIVKEAVDKTQSDPLFEELLNSCCDILRPEDQQTDEHSSSHTNQPTIPSLNGDNTLEQKKRVETTTSTPPLTNPHPHLSTENIPAPCSVVEVTSSETHNDQIEKSIENLTPQQNLCFPSSSNHMILKTPSKNAQYLQVIISPGQPDWPTISNVNLMVNSPYHELLKQVENYQSLKDCVKKTRPVRARPIKQNLPEIQKTGLIPNRVDCHVIRDLNFTRDCENDENVKKNNDRSPQLKSLVNSVKNLKEPSQRGNHVRVLEFETPQKQNGGGKTTTPVTERTKEVANTLVSLSTSVVSQEMMSTNKVGNDNHHHHNHKRKKSSQEGLANKRSKRVGSVPDKTMLCQMDVENFLSKLHYIE